MFTKSHLNLLFKIRKIPFKYGSTLNKQSYFSMMLVKRVNSIYFLQVSM